MSLLVFISVKAFGSVAAGRLEALNTLCCKEKLLYTGQRLDSEPQVGTLSVQIELIMLQLMRIWPHHVFFQCVISWLLFEVGRERDFKKLN